MQGKAENNSLPTLSPEEFSAIDVKQKGETFHHGGHQVLLVPTQRSHFHSPHSTQSLFIVCAKDQLQHSPT